MGKHHSSESSSQSSSLSLLPENSLFEDILGESVLLVLESAQLNILGQTFRPIFCGKVVEVTDGFITIFPVNIKMPNAPQFIFPTPLKFPIEHIAVFTNFDCDTRIPL